jgi:protein SCO1/2
MKRWSAMRAGSLLSLVIGAILGAGHHLALAQHAPAQHAAPAPPVPMARTQVATEAPDVVLTDQDGRRFAFRDLRGKAVLVSFVYTSCPDVCPVMFHVVTEVQKRVQAEGHGDVVSVFVTTDPEIDSPQVLKTFALRRSVDFSATTLLTGKPDELQAVWSAFGVKVKRQARGLVDHSPLTVLIDARGVIRYRYLSGFPDADIIAADVRNVLKSSATK